MSHSLHSGENRGRLETVPTKSKPSRRSQNILGHVCEYWLNCFVSAEGKNGGQFYTPSCALRGIEADFGPEHADTFRRDFHPDLPANTSTRASAKARIFNTTQIPGCFWFLAKNNAVAFENIARLFGGETKLGLVA
jgi:type I restriction-modification system DNA methylase subunit